MSAIERLTITLPAEMAGLVKGAVDDGDYASTSEVIREALREWKLRRDLRLGQLAELKADIARGLADVANGRVADFDSKRIIARGRKLLADRSEFASPKQRRRT
jgi:antitoxin ParD1/3/4